MKILKGRKIWGGNTTGTALVSNEAISFYGGVDPETGIVTEKGHPLEGQSLADKILVFPRGKGSTVGAYALYWMKNVNTAPKAIINQECETIVAVGAIISEIPCIDLIDIAQIKTGDKVIVNADEGEVKIL